jgi:hypothetical protein
MRCVAALGSVMGTRYSAQRLVQKVPLEISHETDSVDQARTAVQEQNVRRKIQKVQTVANLPHPGVAETSDYEPRANLEYLVKICCHDLPRSSLASHQSRPLRVPDSPVEIAAPTKSRDA